MRESQLFRQRAAECRDQAAAAELDNVRERCLRSEAAWTAMAERSVLTETARAAREAATASGRRAAADPNGSDLVTAVRPG